MINCERGKVMSQFKIKVKGIVKNKDRYLIVKKWYDDNINEPYKWEFIDNKVEFGNTPENTVIETVYEMTGLNVDIERILYTWTYQIGDVQYLGLTYLCNADDDTVVLSEELNECKWVKFQEFSEYIDNDMVLEDINKVL